MIQLSKIEKTYRRRDGTSVTALRDVSLSIQSGEFVTVRGTSGSGKSTLMNILGCLDTPTSGIYRLAGNEVSHYTDRQRSELRCRQIGFVFQAFNLLPRTTALENVELPAWYIGEQVNRSKALTLLNQVGLADRAEHFVTELSGGEQQRVAIARALMNDAPLLLADEPTGNLDTAAGQSVMELLTELNQGGRTIVLVTHDPQVASYAARELLIRDGVIATDRPQASKVSPANQAGTPQ